MGCLKKELQVAYSNVMETLLKKQKWSHASDLFYKARVQTFPALMRNLMYTFICRMDDSQNTIITLLSNPRFILHKVSHLWDNITLVFKYVEFFCILYCLFYFLIMELESGNTIKLMNVWLDCYISTDRQIAIEASCHICCILFYYYYFQFK